MRHQPVNLIADWFKCHPQEQEKLAGKCIAWNQSKGIVQVADNFGDLIRKVKASKIKLADVILLRIPPLTLENR